MKYEKEYLYMKEIGKMMYKKEREFSVWKTEKKKKDKNGNSKMGSSKEYEKIIIKMEIDIKENSKMI